MGASAVASKPEGMTPDEAMQKLDAALTDEGEAEPAETPTIDHPCLADLTDEQKLQIFDESVVINERITDARRRVGKCKTAHDIAKAALKEAEEEERQFSRELNDLYESLNPSRYPLFNQPGSQEGEAAGVDPVTKSVDELQISDGIRKALAKAEVTTIGGLQKFNSLTDIPGIGESKANELDDALAVFWAENSAPKSAEPTL